MSVKEKGFWSTTSGVVTGIAGTLTGIVGLVTVAAQMGWIGSDGDGGAGNVDTQAPTTVAGSGAGRSAGGGGGSGGANQGSATPTFTVDPPSLSFEAVGPRKQTVTVLNSGSTPITVEIPKVEGANPTQFTASAPTCTRSRLDPNRTCEIEVSFTPSRSGTYRATLVVQASGARPQEVPLSGTALL